MDGLPPASSIIEGALYQGNLLGFTAFATGTLDVHVACPAEYPPDPSGAAEVIFFPLKDDPTTNWLGKTLWCRQVLKVARKVAGDITEGKTVLVTCAAGLNRSGLVSALALCGLGWTPNEAINAVREARPGALFNQQFVKVIRALGPKV